MNVTHVERIALVLLALTPVVGCNEQKVELPAAPAVQTQAVAVPAAPQGPEALIAKSKSLFGALPAVMESPKNPVTEPKVVLGRQLYFETRLSKNHDLSCNSCHVLDSYGIDPRPNNKTSEGHKGQFGGRNSPTSYNAALHFVQFWDGRAADVEEQAKGPILNPVEMAMPDEASVIAVLESIPGYLPLFQSAFPEAEKPITYDNVAAAIGAFERKLVTPGRFHKFLGGDASALDEKEQRGLSLFIDAGCIACHQGPGLGGGMYQKLGLLKPYPTSDAGRFDATKVESDRGFFKVPSLLNIARTAPYFHDGSIATLEQAVRIMAEYQTAKGTLTDAEVADLVAFLNALTGELPVEYIKEPPALAAGPKTPKPNPN